jgi:hypothetical protein
MNKTRSKKLDIAQEFMYEYGFDAVDAIKASLDHLTVNELAEVQDALNAGHRLVDIAHDIHGMARCHYGPAYHRDTFLPRVVGRSNYHSSRFPHSDRCRNFCCHHNQHF